MARHMTKNEIISSMREVRRIEKTCDKSPFTGMATLCNYVLWKNEGYGQKRLAAYNDWIAEYDKRIDDGEYSLQEMSERLYRKANFTVEYEPFTEKDIHVSKKDKFGYDLQKRIVQSNNIINEMSTRYFLIHFNVLIDMCGYGKKRLERNKDCINKMLSDIHDVESVKIMDLHRELVDGVGIYIEMPKIM